MTDGNRQRADVVVMAMSNGNGVDFFIGDQTVERESLPALSLGMSAGIHKEPIAIKVQQPGASADGSIRIQIHHSHSRPFRPGGSYHGRRGGVAKKIIGETAEVLVFTACHLARVAELCKDKSSGHVFRNITFTIRRSACRSTSAA